MDQVHIKVLKDLTLRYGEYEVVKAISRITTGECKENYAGNPGAIIHTDAHILSSAVNQMHQARTLRMMS